MEVAPLDSVPVYYGTQMECLFLQTALEGSGIPASIKNLSASVGPGEDVRLYVLRGDVERALPLIEAFKMHGRKSRPQQPVVTDLSIPHERLLSGIGSLVDGRIVGTITATVALLVLGFVALGLYTSLAGLMIASSIAAIAGAAAGALAEPARSGRNAAIVAGYIAILILAYMLVGQTVGKYAPTGSRDRAGVTPSP